MKNDVAPLLFRDATRRLTSTVTIVTCSHEGERHAVGDWVAAPDSLPYLADAQANVFCDIEQIVRHGTHSIVIGGVTDIRLNETIAPLLYENGQYARSTQLAAV